MSPPRGVCLTFRSQPWMFHNVQQLRHGWGWQLPQTASLRHTQSVWAHWYAVHGHMAVASNSYTNSTWVRFLGSGSLVESKWCPYVMVEAHIHLKLLPASILDICKVFEHIDILFRGIQQQPWTVIPTILGSDFVVPGSLVKPIDVITSWFRLTANSNCFLHPHHTYKKFLSTLICCPWAYGSSLKELYPPYLALTLWLWVTCRVKMMSLCHGWGWQPPQIASCVQIIHVHSVWAHWYAVHGHMVVASITLYPHYLGQILVTCEVKMMSLCHGWGWHPTWAAAASTLDINKVFEHIDMLSICIR